MRLIFFDVDGTLSAPAYPVDGQMKIGMSDESWYSYCKNAGDDGYMYCDSVPAVADYAKRCKDAGDRLFVLTVVYDEHETGAKVKFTDTKYPGLFEEVISVYSEAGKLEKIKEYAEKYGVGLADCEIVDDTFNLLLKALNEGITATHVINLCSEFEKRLMNK